MKKLLTFLVIICFTVLYVKGQQTYIYNDIATFGINTGTPKHGIKIKTTFPYLGNTHMPTLKIEGYNYSYEGANPSIIDIKVSWYLSGNRTFYGHSASSSGSTAPDIWLSNENGKIVVFIDQRVYSPRLKVSVFCEKYNEKPEYFQGWSIADEALTNTEKVLVPYKTQLAGDIIIGNDRKTDFEQEGSKLYFGTKNENKDGIYLSRVNIIDDHSELRLRLGDDGSEKFIIGVQDWKDYLWKDRIVFQANGRVGIKVSDPTCELDVNGKIRAKEVKIEATGWSDFVFDKNYNLPTLQEVEKHINQKGTLPDIPSEKEVIEDGINVGDMQAKLLQKIEELTLYVIQQDKEIKDLRKENEEQNKVIKELTEKNN